jgi:hypothetical protein
MLKEKMNGKEAHEEENLREGFQHRERKEFIHSSHEQFRRIFKSRYMMMILRATSCQS